MTMSKICQAMALSAAFCSAAPMVGLAQSAMKPLNEAEMRELRIYEAKELTRRAVELGQAGKNAEAVPLAEQALERREKALPPGHVDLSASVVMLGVLYQRVGRYGEAEPLLKRGLEMRDKAKPADLHSIVSSLNILGTFYDALNRFSEAEPLLKRALELREKLLEGNSPQIVASLNRLAALHETEGRYRDAQRLYKRSLDLRETLTVVPLGKGPDGKTGQLTLARGYVEHADTISALAHIYGAQGRLGEAERLFKRVPDMYEKVLRAEAPGLRPSRAAPAARPQCRGRGAVPACSEASRARPTA